MFNPRQSFGIARAYRRADPQAAGPALTGATGIVAVLLCAWWGYRQLRLGLAGRLNTGHSLFVALHLLVTAVFILHFTVNFHHYLVDGVIWKRRKSAA